MKSRGKDIRFACEGKRPLSRQAAMRSHYALLQRHHTTGDQYQAYECQYCGHWHVGHQDRKLTRKVAKLVQMPAGEVPTRLADI